jgi:hypothetical protein
MSNRATVDHLKTTRKASEVHIASQLILLAASGLLKVPEPIVSKILAGLLIPTGLVSAIASRAVRLQQEWEMAKQSGSCATSEAKQYVQQRRRAIQMKPGEEVEKLLYQNSYYKGRFTQKIDAYLFGMIKQVLEKEKKLCDPFSGSEYAPSKPWTAAERYAATKKRVASYNPKIRINFQSPTGLNRHTSLNETELIGVKQELDDLRLEHFEGSVEKAMGTLKFLLMEPDKNIEQAKADATFFLKEEANLVRDIAAAYNKELFNKKLA